MVKYTKLTAISGKQLTKLLEKDGWIIKGQATHGVSLAKLIGDRTVVTIVPDTNASLPVGTLGAILGVKQTGIGKTGLLELVNKYGL